MPKMGSGVMAMVANAASSLQRKAESGEVRSADAEALPYLAMEEILERCKLHNYERLFLTKYSFKPLTHTYFAVASGNPTEQFHYFTSICAWLMSLQRVTWRAPSQMDDPNSSVNALYSQLQQIGAPTNYPPQKLKQGYGEHCCAVLKHLLDQLPLEFKRATYTEELEYEEAAVDEDAEVEVDELADEWVRRTSRRTSTLAAAGRPTRAAATRRSSTTPSWTRRSTPPIGRSSWSA